MPSKTWTSQDDWINEWQNISGADFTSSPGDVRIAQGETEAIIRSNPFQASNWLRWSRLKLTGNLPTGTNILARFRTADSEANLENAAWSPWFDLWTETGVAIIDLAEYFANNPNVTAGSWIQIEVKLMAG